MGIAPNQVPGITAHVRPSTVSAETGTNENTRTASLTAMSAMARTTQATVEIPVECAWSSMRWTGTTTAVRSAIEAASGKGVAVVSIMGIEVTVDDATTLAV